MSKKNGLRIATSYSTGIEIFDFDLAPSGARILLDPEGGVLDQQCASDSASSHLDEIRANLARGSKPMFYTNMLRLVRRAVQGGARKSGSTWEWDVSGNCKKPVVREFWSRLPADHDITGLTAGISHTMTLIMHCKCRTCEPCLAKRAAHWRYRTKAETASAHRTWFGTLTLSPDARYRLLARAHANRRNAGVNFSELTEDQLFAVKHREIAREITLYLKRLREQSAAVVRYLCVAEAHQSGEPHYHMLVHEIDPERPIRHAVLKAQWTLGFSDWKLVTDERQAVYVCKYLTKDSRARVRASLSYGNTTSGHTFTRSKMVIERPTEDVKEHLS